MITINREVKLTICIRNERYIKILRDLISAGKAELQDHHYIGETETDKVANLFLEHLLNK